MVEQLLRNRDELDFGYTQDHFETCVAEHFVVAETEGLQSGNANALLPPPQACALSE